MAGESQHQDSCKSSLDPFRAWGPKKIHDTVDSFLSRSHLHAFEAEIRRGALLAQDPDAFATWDELDREEGKPVFPGSAQREPQIFPDEKQSLCSELGKTANESGRMPPQETWSISNNTNRLRTQFQQSWRQYWSQHYMIHALVGCCSLGAAVQGWDESAVNGGKVSGSPKMPA